MTVNAVDTFWIAFVFIAALVSFYIFDYRRRSCFLGTKVKKVPPMPPSSLASQLGLIPLSVVTPTSRLMLMHIKDVVCPHCGSGIVSESYQQDGKGGTYRDENGEHGESRSFECGIGASWSLPFGYYVGPADSCKNSSVRGLRTEKRMKAKAAFESFVNSFDVDDTYKERILRDVRNYPVDW